METTRLNPDNRIIGEHIAQAIKRANPENRRDGVTATSVAKAVPISKVSLSRVMAGTRGLAEEKLIAVAGAIGTHPGNLILGISPRGREDRYPHIPSPNTRNKNDIASKGLAVASVEALVKNPRALSHFFGGIEQEHRQSFIDQLVQMRQHAATLRKSQESEARSDSADAP